MSPPFPMAGYAVLVVDDEPLVRLDTMDIVADSGLSAYGTGDAATALGMFEQHPDIRILLADIEMPGAMDGLELAFAVRKRWPAAIILMASGKRDVLKGDMPEGATFFLKPYTPSAIIRCLRESAGSIFPIGELQPQLH